ncbi:hypothetical protein [Flavobacterium marginilacus]|uniref:hypothetical protein n=1 Tax=Flavobacterium marginilacus TaxID=3003256 RepID=UPI00248F4166|nr:hypothetical protein [Flavobacterium marginilacus]
MKASKRYNELIIKLETDLILLNEKFKKHQKDFNQDTTNWGYVGELGFVSEKIDEVLKFLN